MIQFAGYGWLDWKEVKAAWKRGRRGIPKGTAWLPCEVYAVGEGFYMHPLGTAVSDTEALDRREPNHTMSVGQSPVYGNNYCGYLNSY